jgi:hypothetical protein
MASSDDPRRRSLAPVSVSASAEKNASTDAKTIRVTVNNVSHLDEIGGNVLVYSSTSKESESANFGPIAAGDHAEVDVSFGDTPPDSFAGVLNGYGYHWSFPATLQGAFTELDLTITD